MSSGRRRIESALAALVCLATTAATAAGAQDIRELTRRVDAAVLLRNKAALELVAYRKEISSRHLYTDTVAIAGGAVLIVTTRELSPDVRLAAMDADSVHRKHLGLAAARARGLVLSVRPDSANGSTYKKSRLATVARKTDAGEILNGTTKVNLGSIARLLAAQVPMRLLEQEPRSLSFWLGSLPVDTTTDEGWSTIRLELVTSPLAEPQHCYAGDLAACKSALGLTESVDPLGRWYESAGARQPGAPEPVSGTARVTLLAQAIAMGGPNAMVRLLDSKGSVSDVLSATANAPVDSIVAVWRRQVHDRGFVSASFSPMIGAITLGWILLLGCLSLRSSRWR